MGRVTYSPAHLGLSLGGRLCGGVIPSTQPQPALVSESEEIPGFPAQWQVVLMARFLWPCCWSTLLLSKHQNATCWCEMLYSRGGTCRLSFPLLLVL